MRAWEGWTPVPQPWSGGAGVQSGGRGAGCRGLRGCSWCPLSRDEWGLHSCSLCDGSSSCLSGHVCQFSAVAQSCPTPCDPMDCSTPGFPVHHRLLELAQTHVHRVIDAIQPSHPLSSSSPAFSLSQHRGNESAPHIRWPKYWSFSFSISPSSEYSGLDFL